MPDEARNHFINKLKFENKLNKIEEYEKIS